MDERTHARTHRSSSSARWTTGPWRWSPGCVLAAEQTRRAASREPRRKRRHGDHGLAVLSMSVACTRGAWCMLVVVFWRCVLSAETRWILRSALGDICHWWVTQRAIETCLSGNARIDSAGLLNSLSLQSSAPSLDTRSRGTESNHCATGNVSPFLSSPLLWLAAVGASMRDVASGRDRKLSLWESRNSAHDDCWMRAEESIVQAGRGDPASHHQV